MENKIKHFLVDLDEIQSDCAYDSDTYKLIKKIKEELDDLLFYLRED